MSGSKSFSDLIFPRFLSVFWSFFKSCFVTKNHSNLAKTILAKPWKSLIFPRKYWYFQGFEDSKFQWPSKTKHEKSQQLRDIDFLSFLDGFWRGFGGPKPQFSHFIWLKSITKKHDVVEGAKEPPRRGKKLLPGALTPSGPSPGGQFREPGCRLGDIGGRIKNNQKK